MGAPGGRLAPTRSRAAGTGLPGGGDTTVHSRDMVLAQGSEVSGEGGDLDERAPGRGTGGPGVSWLQQSGSNSPNSPRVGAAAPSS